MSGVCVQNNPFRVVFVSQSFRSRRFFSFTSLTALVATSEDKSGFSFLTYMLCGPPFTRPLVTVSLKRISDFTHPTLHCGIEYPVPIIKWSFLSSGCWRTAALSYASTSNFLVSLLLNVPYGVLSAQLCGLTFDKPIRCTSPSNILSRFMSQTEVVHWRFDYILFLGRQVSNLNIIVVARVIQLLLEPVYHHYDFATLSQVERPHLPVGFCLTYLFYRLIGLSSSLTCRGHLLL